MKKQRTKKDLLKQASDLRFEERKSSMLNDAMRDYHAQRPDLLMNDASSEAKTWGILAHQIVGHETF